jgi:hypothetical protein
LRDYDRRYDRDYERPTKSFGGRITTTLISMGLVFTMIEASISYRLLTVAPEIGAVVWVICGILTCYITLALGSIVSYTTGRKDPRDWLLYMLVGLITIVAIGWFTHQNPLMPIYLVLHTMHVL